jgi:hypothetical protein
MEQRKSPRIPFRFPCEIVGAHAGASGVVLDLSEGGLSLQTEFPFEPGDCLQLRLQPPECGEIGVEGLVWHARRVRQRRSGDVRSVLGLILSEAPDEYRKLISKPAPRGDRPDSDPRAGARGRIDESPPKLRAFRIRVKHRLGPRTRVLSLSAQSETEARSVALRELTDEWELLEIHAG